MKEEDRRSMINHHRDKAHHILEQADLMMTMGAPMEETKVINRAKVVQ